MTFSVYKEDSLQRLLKFKKELLILITDVESSMIRLQCEPDNCEQWEEDDKELLVSREFESLKENLEGITLEHKEWMRDDI